MWLDTLAQLKVQNSPPGLGRSSCKTMRVQRVGVGARGGLFFSREAGPRSFSCPRTFGFRPVPCIHGGWGQRFCLWSLCRSYHTWISGAAVGFGNELKSYQDSGRAWRFGVTCQSASNPIHERSRAKFIF